MLKVLFQRDPFIGFQTELSAFALRLSCILMLCLMFTFPFQTFAASDLQLTPEEQAYLNGKPYISVYVSDSLPPFSFMENGSLKGYSLDYVRLMGQVLGADIRFESEPWFEALDKLKKGELDLIPYIAITEERQQFVDYTPYSHIEYTTGAVFRKDMQLSQNQLKDAVIAVSKNTFLHAYLKKNYPDNKLFMSTSTAGAVLAVSDGKADIAVGSLPALEFYIQKNWLSNLNVSQVEGLALPQTTVLPMGVTKGNELLRSILVKAHAQISYSEAAALKSKWMNQFDTVGVEGLSEEEIAFLDERKHITTCVDPRWLPLEAIDKGLHVGISADFLALIETRLDIQFDLVPSKSWQGSLQLGREGLCDIFPLITQTPSREEFLNFTQPYIKTPLVLATDIQIPYIADITQLTGKRIGVSSGYAFYPVLVEQYPDLDFVEVANIDEGLQKVQAGELFGYADSLVSVGYSIQHEYLGQLKVSSEFDKNWQLGMGVQKSLQPLLSILDKAIAQTTAFERQEIINKWISIRYQKGTNWWITGIGVLATVLILGAVIAWYSRLNKRLGKEVLLRQQAEQEAINLAHTDQLTGLLNRHGSAELIKQEMARNQRKGTPVSLMIMDVDHFKHVNDEYGHKVGDDVLKLLAATLTAQMRATDHLVRWGGEEFLVLVPDVAVDDAVALADKYRTAVENIAAPNLPRFTVSIGVAQLAENEGFSHWYQHTDAALYKAKNSGRNRVCAWQEGDPVDQDG